MSFNAVICMAIISYWIWCCSCGTTQYKINWISVQSVVNSFVYCKLVPSICNIHTMTLLVSQIFIVLLELKLQYSRICCCVVCALRAKGRTFVYSCYCMNNRTCHKRQEEHHARLWDDTKLQLKQPTLNFLQCSM